MFLFNRSTFPIVIGFSLFVLGTELFNTFQSLRLHLEGVSNQMISVVSAAGSMGLVLAACLAPAQLRRLGPTSTLMICTLTIATITFVQGLIISPILWIFLRLLTGMSTGIVFITVQSWLLSVEEKRARNRSLALYMMTFNLAQGCAQFMLNCADLHSNLLFWISSILVAAGCSSYLLVQTTPQALAIQPGLSGLRILKRSPAGAIGSVIAGMLISSYFSFGPICLKDAEIPIEKMGIAMACWVFGGFAFQRPLAILSDRYSRSLIIGIISLLTGILALLVAWGAPWLPFHCMLPLLVLFGGCAFSLYPLSIAHADNRIAGESAVKLSSAMLFMNALGAISGPFLAAISLNQLGPTGLFWFVAGLSAVLCIFIKLLPSRISSSSPQG